MSNRGRSIVFYSLHWLINIFHSWKKYNLSIFHQERIGGSGGLITGIAIYASSGVLNYGQGLFGGLNTCRKQNGFIVKFRPEEDASRMVQGAERMCMPSPTVGRFLEIVKLMMVKNKHWFRQGSLFICVAALSFFLSIQHSVIKLVNVQRCTHELVYIWGECFKGKFHDLLRLLKPCCHLKY
ncbi:hypothetical protein MKW98_015854 [Papaver atlanticum]|uniref:Uncharacterized protein n=1 Tax=Papaver atlanticum TaxID=357466 RepID=A0AAD4T468_9MAGN|nr:hypothetical protein MKW98_015854 [Papaver atlanticum]